MTGCCASIHFLVFSPPWCPAGHAMGGTTECITCGRAPINCPRGETLQTPRYDPTQRAAHNFVCDFTVPFVDHGRVCGLCLCDWRVSLLLPEVHSFPPLNRVVFCPPQLRAWERARAYFVALQMVQLWISTPDGGGRWEIPGWNKVKSVIDRVASLLWRSLLIRV